MTKELALITGASSGIGEAFARQLARKGADLCLTGRRTDRLESIAAELIHTYQVGVEVITADLSTAPGIEKIEAWIKTHPAITLLVNNAGFGIRGRFADQSADEYADMIMVHVTAAMKLTSAVLPGMINAHHGAIINVSSITAFMPLAGNAVYSGTKSFLNSFTRALSYELKNTGLKVQLLAPGFTYSDFHKRPGYTKLDTYSAIPGIFWMNADDVAKISLDALNKNRLFCIPGGINRIIAFAGQSGLGALGTMVISLLYRKSPQKTEIKERP